MSLHGYAISPPNTPGFKDISPGSVFTKAYEEGYAVALIKDRATIELTAVFAW